MRDDAAAAAELHKRSFPGDLFTLAGEGVLIRLYQEFADELSLVAKLNGQLVGYTVGTLDKSRFMRRLARRHGALLVAGMATAMIGHAREAPGYGRGFMRWMVTSRPTVEHVTAVAMYDAMSTEARRLGISPLAFLGLHARWMVYAEQRGAQRIEGQVTDERMLAALSRLGYRLDRTIDTRSGKKYYISSHVPADGAHRWAAQGTSGTDAQPGGGSPRASTPAAIDRTDVRT